jgi:hypothetical protein
MLEKSEEGLSIVERHLARHIMWLICLNRRILRVVNVARKFDQLPFFSVTLRLLYEESLDGFPCNS